MNIKDACRYQNFLTQTISTLKSYLNRETNVVQIKEKHLKTKVNSEAQDEELDNTPERLYKASIVSIVGFVDKLINEKLKVSTAIENAKRDTKIDWMENNNKLTLDTAIEYNKNVHEYVSTLEALTKIKSTETKTQGTDYKFNVEGNQMSYRYPVEIVKTIDFDRNVVKTLHKDILSKADRISTKIDEVMLMDIVQYTPEYNIHDTVEDLLNNLTDNQ